jgi:hypothetical protein
MTPVLSDRSKAERRQRNRDRAAKKKDTRKSPQEERKFKCLEKPSIYTKKERI